MRSSLQLFAIGVVLVVFSSVGLFYWNLAAIRSQERIYSKELMSRDAAEQFEEDIENGFVRIIWFVNSSHLFGSAIYPGIPSNCVAHLLERGVQTYVDSLVHVEQAYWGERYHLLYPGPYLDFAEAYNNKAVNYWLEQGDNCLLSHFGEMASLPNKPLKPLRLRLHSDALWRAA